MMCSSVMRVSAQLSGMCRIRSPNLKAVAEARRRIKWSKRRLRRDCEVSGDRTSPASAFFQFFAELVYYFYYLHLLKSGRLGAQKLPP